MMIAFKCKICGGNLEIEQGESISTCTSCGSTHSLPNLNNDKVKNLYERANQLRRDHAFDKAMGMYETILTEQPDDPEVYWSLVLCRYGVEYVEDPKTKQRVITTHRTLPQSVQVDSDYKKAIQLASSEAKTLYQQEARAIDDIQKGILAISNQEDPYDIFICYKETDDKGKRTIDSVLGQQLHDELVGLGYKVFFARITLENTLGRAYEPYIYSALTTAKVMLVLGTKKEYFESPWVRNEWGRYLVMMVADKKKTLIPMYRDMEAYDLPEEFRVFQAQDFNKIGAAQDVVRGIKKLIPLKQENEVEEKRPLTSAREQVQSSDGLLKRAALFVEDEEWDSALEYINRILDQNPSDAKAYLLKTFANHEVQNLEELIEKVKSNELAQDKDFLKVKRFGDRQLLDSIKREEDRLKEKERIEQERLKEEQRLEEEREFTENLIEVLKSFEMHGNERKDLYDEILNYLEGKRSSQYSIVEEKIRHYQDLKHQLEQERLKEIQAQTTETYKQIVQLLKAPSIDNYEKVINLALQIIDYEDVKSLRDFENVELSKMQDEFYRKQQIAIKKIKKRKLISFTIITSIISSFILGLVYTFAIASYRVEFNTNGGNALPPISIQVNRRIDENLPEATRNLHSFNGWYFNQELTKSVNGKMMPASNITLYAKWSINQYQVNFVTNGGQTMSPQMVTYNQSITLANPTRTGYTFVGWFEDSGLTEPFTLTQMPANDITVYAKWIINQYTISFQSNGGTSVNPITQDYGTSVGAPTPPTKTGYTFMGWYRDEALSTGYIFNTMPAESPTLYAKWIINQYTISFQSNGGTSVNPITQDYGTSVGAPTPPTKTGYTFMGWYRDEAFNTGYSFTTMPAESPTLYAKWSINQYTISFQSNGGTSINPITQDYGTSVSAPTPPTKTGYTFAGWFTDINLSQFPPVTMPASNITLYAKWTVNQYTVTFNTNGGDFINIQTKNFGSPLVIPTPTRVGHSFAGWFTDINLSQVPPVTMPASNITLYAKWTLNQYNISYFPVLFDNILKITREIDSDHRLLLTSGGRIYAWGNNSFGQLGDGSSVINREKPVLTKFTNLKTEETFIDISTGRLHSLALTNQGRVFAWGGNNRGQLGVGNTNNSYTPKIVTFEDILESDEKIIQISAGSDFSVALSSSGRVVTWGSNFSGQLGIDFTTGTSGFKTTPTLVIFPYRYGNFFPPSTYASIDIISAGLNHTLAISGNTVYTWGANSVGQLGDGTVTNKTKPVIVNFPQPFSTQDFIIDVSAGSSFSMILTSNGRLFSWGYNAFGQLGDGSFLYSSIPIEIEFSELSSEEVITKINTGAYRAFAITNFGSLYGWGKYESIFSTNASRTGIDQNIPKRISILDNNNLIITNIFPGISNSYILTTEKIYGWGIIDNTEFYRPTIIVFNEIALKISLLENYAVYNFSDNINLSIPTLEGYVFEGWFMDEALTIPFNLTTMPANDVMLYAKFTPVVD